MLKKSMLLVAVLLLVLLVPACGREEGLGAGGGQSLREGSTAPFHSPIAQDETYQTVLGLNILLYPAPIDDEAFEGLGAAHWELDPTPLTEQASALFSGEMGEELVYEPVVEGLQDNPFVAELQEAVFGGAPVQVGWAYGNNNSLDFLEFNNATTVMIPVYPVVIFAAAQDALDSETWQISTDAAEAFYAPEKAVIEFLPETLHSMPVRVIKDTGHLTLVVTPAGTGVEPAAAGEGIDQARVAQNRWVFAHPDASGEYYEGLTGRNTQIEAADTSARF